MRMAMMRTAPWRVASCLVLVLATALNGVTLSRAFFVCRAPQRRRRTAHLLATRMQSSPMAPSNQTASSFFAMAVPGPSVETKPDYEKIHGPLGKLMDYVFLLVFRHRLAQQLGHDSQKAWHDYTAITDLAAEMNRKFSQQELKQRAVNVLLGLFPSWMPPSYAVLFSKPFPAISARMNAWATSVAGTWLMGECEINNVILDDGSLAVAQGLLVHRCRFLEESGCASVCVNSCKIPTQTFFMEHMQLPLTMEPNYDTFECQFSFGKAPNMATEEDAKATPCLMRCPVWERCGRCIRKVHYDQQRVVTIRNPAIKWTRMLEVCP